jgi:chemotaxis methyl-accepting protein methylase/pimeloyl-ACP methyl ester carboxylesterase
MLKRLVVNGFLILLAAAGVLHADRLLGGDERRVDVKSANDDYTIAALVGETEHYSPAFTDDRLLTLDGKPVAQFTMVEGAVTDYYWRVTDPDDLAFVEKIFGENRAKIEAAAPGIIEALARYRATQPTYPREGLYGLVQAKIKDTTSVSPQKVLGQAPVPEKVDAALFQYLRSNGVSDLAQLGARPAFVNTLVNKFYTLGTTCFYRDFPLLKAMIPYWPPLRARAEKEGRPFKIHVFACSTGEEVITYAVELLEAGVRDFTILGTDINDAGLRYAQAMRYPPGSLERLPLAAQAKIKKYFQYNAAVGAWEPKDPVFFKSRIKYMTQDLLKDLPSDLDPRFAPPYDVVSILNVLFYLDDGAVQARKGVWARLLAPGGILALHDFHYSVLNGTLGLDWAFKNFLPVNEWVNVRADFSMDENDRISFQEKRFRDNPADDTFLALIQTYSFTGRADKAAHLAESFLEKKPRSVLALRSLMEIERQDGHTEKTEQLLQRLLKLQPHNPEILARAASSEKDPQERNFLSTLGKKLAMFLEEFKNRPRDMETVFDFSAPSTARYGHLRLLLKAYAAGALQNRYLSLKKPADADRVRQEGLRCLAENLPQAADYPAMAQYLDQLAEDALEDRVDGGRPAEALDLHDALAVPFASAMKPLEADNPYARSFLGHMALYKGLALQALNRPAEARAPLDEAVTELESVLETSDEPSPSRRSFLLGDAGRARMARADLLVRSEETLAARLDRERALLLFEEGLSLNPAYGKSLYTRRRELLERMESGRRASAKAPVPLHGAPLRFRDEYGPYRFETQIVRYKSEDGADIEATLLIPEKTAPPRPGLVFVHMWARDRATWWGFPEFMASHGYPSITMDLRGHGNSHYPGSNRRVTLQDDEVARESYKTFFRDVTPAMARLAAHPSFRDGRWVMVGASLGCPVGVLAAEAQKENLMAMVMLSPSLAYFGVDCESALRRMSKVPLFVMAEKTDKSFRDAKAFFDVADGYKTYFQLENAGHGTDALYRDVGLPTVILSWLENVAAASASLPQ